MNLISSWSDCEVLYPAHTFMMHAYLTHLLLQKHWLSFYFGYISDRQIHNRLITSPLAVGSLIVLFSYLLLKVPIVADTV
jgi:hypothetical protein